MDNMIAFGCSFSLDDFGSGLSSFSYLQKLPVNIIKIDGAFVRDMDTNEVNRIFVENIKRSANAMNKKIVAEFVENAEIESLLTEIGIDYGQGYLFISLNFGILTLKFSDRKHFNCIFMVWANLPSNV